MFVSVYTLSKNHNHIYFNVFFVCLRKMLTFVICKKRYANCKVVWLQIESWWCTFCAQFCIVHCVRPVLSTCALLNVGYLILLWEKYITSCACGYNFYSVVKVLHVLEMPTCINVIFNISVIHVSAPYLLHLLILKQLIWM